MKVIIINNIIPRNFTGICKTLIDESIRYYKNGMEHREDGPATEYKDCYKSWDFKNKCFGYNNDFTNKTWKKKVKHLKRQEKLSIFI